MKTLIFLILSLALIGCGSKPAAQPPVATAPPQQVAPGSPAPPVVVAQQPYPASPQGSAAREQPPAQPAEAEAVNAPAPVIHADITIPSGTPIRVRLNQALDTRRNRAGDRFSATLAEPIVEHGRTLLPKGTRFSGHITTAQASGRMEGRAVLGVTLDSFELHGARYPLVTSRASRVSARHKKRNLVLIGGGSGLGALIGGLAGGGRGALIGAGAGAGAGTAGAAFTGKKNVSLPAETLLTFRLQESVDL